MPLEAIIKKILNNSPEAYTAAALAEKINGNRLLKNKNNIPVSSAQILAYAKNHPEFFRVSDNMVSLKKYPLNEDLADNDINSLLKSFFNHITGYTKNDIDLFDVLTFSMVTAVMVRHLNKENKLPDTHKPDEKFINTNIFETIKDFREYILSLNKQNVYRGLFDKLLHETEIAEATLPVLFKLNICLKDTGYQLFINCFDKVYLEHHTQQLPGNIYNLLARLCLLKGSENIYDPACDNGYLVLNTYTQNNKIRIFLQDADTDKLTITRLNLILHACFSFHVYKGDPVYKPGVFSNKMDVVLSVPPAGFNVKKEAKQSYPFKNVAWENKVEDLYIQMMITRMNYRGKMLVAVPDRFLYRKSSAPVRRNMINDDILEAVIKLPENETMGKNNLSVIILNKNKMIKRKKKVLFVNAGELFINNNRDDAHEQDAVSQLISLVADEQEEVSGKINVKWVDAGEVKEQEDKLSVIRYTHPVKNILDDAQKKGEQLVSLKDITKLPVNPKRKDNKSVPYVTTENLNEDILDIYLDIEKVPYIKDLPPTAQQVNCSVILLSANSKTLRPTFFDYKGTPVFIDKDVYALKVIPSEVDLEYLIFQLNSDMARRQLDIFQHESKNQPVELHDIRNIKIIKPSMPEQINKAGEVKDRLSGKYLLTSFINEIKMVTNNYDVKREIERFAGKYLKNTEYIEYRTSLEFEEFPFNDTEIRNHQYIKYSEDKHHTFVLLINQERHINGVLIINGNVPPDTKTYAEINTYAGFLIQLKEHITKKVANDNMARFAHTSKNFFAGIQGELHALLNSKNEELVNTLKSSYPDDEEFINYKIKKDHVSRDTFTAYNTLKNINEKLASISAFYLKTDKNFKNIVNSEPEHFDIVGDIMALKKMTGEFELKSRKEAINVYAKRDAVRNSLLDLIQNAKTYSPDKHFKIIIKNKSGFAFIQIENAVSAIISEERYKKLGKEWVRKDGESLGSGIYWAFQVIEDSYGHIELGDYETYVKDKIFLVKIKLKN